MPQRGTTIPSEPSEGMRTHNRLAISPQWGMRRPTAGNWPELPKGTKTPRDIKSTRSHMSGPYTEPTSGRTATAAEDCGRVRCQVSGAAPAKPGLGTTPAWLTPSAPCCGRVHTHALPARVPPLCGQAPYTAGHHYGEPGEPTWYHAEGPTSAEQVPTRRPSHCEPKSGVLRHHQGRCRTLG